MDNSYRWEDVWRNDIYAAEATRELKASRKLNHFHRIGAITDDLGGVVEVGCGGCNFLSKLKAHGTRINSYLGIDKSETALTRAKSRLVGLKNYDLHKGDVSIIPAKDSSINTIIALGLLEHIDHVDQVLKEFYRVAASNCTLIVSTSNKRSFMYFARKFRQAFGLWPYGFQENDSLKTINRLIPFGFELKDAAILHGDNDHPLITAADKFASLFLKDWGRYILFYAAIKQGEK